MRRNPAQRVFSLLFVLSPSIVIFFTDVAMAAQNHTIPVDVGVVLDMDQWIGKMGMSCISMALSDFYASHASYRTRVLIHPRDSKDDVVGAAAAALDLLKNVGVQAIIGPTTSTQAEFVINLGNKAQVPIISFTATSGFLSPFQSPYFIRATQNDSSQIKAISALVQAFGWREVVPIYVANEFGEGIMPSLADALQDINARIPYRSVISPVATDDQIVAELYKLATMQSRVFVVHLLPSLASQLFTKAKEVGMMEKGYAWIITDAVTNSLSSMETLGIDSMQGVLGVQPYVPRTKPLKNFTFRWRTKYQQENPTVVLPDLDVFGLWACDAATALAMAIEKVGVPNNTLIRKSNFTANSTDLESIGVSQYGPKLLRALLNTKFTGLSGSFRIVDGQLQSSAYQIVNLIGNGWKGIGFWTTQNGIVRELNARNLSPYSTSKANLGTIIWPGDITSPPKGWVVPGIRKKLRVGVPKKYGFKEFINITQNPDTKKTKVEGYCIDVFDAVMASLPYGVPYEYIPFTPPNGKTDGSYDDLVKKVFAGEFDVVVGDITIIADRSKFVDFSLPFTESGVSMIVKMRDDKKTNAWAFLKPLTCELWFTSFCSFVFIGFVVWVLEHRVNEDFRGPPSHQAGMIFWFSFSTMVFAHKEKVVSNLARFVVNIWCFVVLILIQSYTASLSSILTVQRQQPMFTDVNELKRRGEYIGYQDGSFVQGLLTKQMKFDEKKLINFSSVEELHNLFSKGSGNGGIAAAFDENPYMRLFISNHCSEYTMVGPTYKTDGFGFAFSIGSPLLHDVSRAVLKVTEGDEMVKIENRWIQETTCPESNNPHRPNSLGLDSFWGLFLIAGIASILVLIVFTINFVHEQRHVFRQFNPKPSTWRKIVELAKYFDKKDLSSHTFKKSGFQDKSRTDLGPLQASPMANLALSPSSFSLHTSPNTNCPSSPSSPSYSMGGNFVSHEESPSYEYGVVQVSQEQTTPETMSVIELAHQNQDTPMVPAPKGDNL